MSSLLTALILIASACATSGGYAGDSAGAVTEPDLSDKYLNALHPVALFLSVDVAYAQEAEVVSSCMRSRGWDRYPVIRAGDFLAEMPPQLSVVQNADERLNMARRFGSLLLAATPSDGLEPFREFGNWLHHQSDDVRERYLEDFSGSRGEIEPPGEGSCEAIAVERMRATIPGSVPAVAGRAGELYASLITNTTEYQRRVQRWRACMGQRGYPVVGDPLSVWNPTLDRELESAQGLRDSRMTVLITHLTEQAVTEHECAASHLDTYLRVHELRVLVHLVKEFPMYAALVKR
jgi:hypothetical protein